MKYERFGRGVKHGRASFKLRDAAFNVKALGEDGSLSGYGSVFGVVDSYQEIVAPGAFTESLKERAATKRALPMLWQHRQSEPIGKWTLAQEDEHGLYLEGVLLKDDVQQAKEAYALLKADVISGLSIGYWVRRSSYDEKTGIRTLLELDLDEVSIVTSPANDDARIDAVKYKLARGTLPTIREFEDILREAGFSKTRAACIASSGYAELIRRESGSEDGDAALAKKLEELTSTAAAFQLPKIG